MQHIFRISFYKNISKDCFWIGGLTPRPSVFSQILLHSKPKCLVKQIFKAMTLILNEFEMYPTFKNPCFDFPLFKPFEKCARTHPPRFITVQPKIIIVTDSVIWFPHCLNKFTRDHYHRWSLFSSCRAGRDDYCISTVNLRCHLLKKRIIYLDESIFLFSIFT